MNREENIAQHLLKIEAITLNSRHPYQYSSGIISPIYCDNRLTLSYPLVRQQICAGFVELIEQQQIECDVIAGTATAAIAHAAWLAEALKKPMVYVRSDAKSHGKKNLIEGKISPKQRVIVIEDLISTGGSAINAALALREAGATVNNCLAIFSYQFADTAKTFSENAIDLQTLSNFTTLVEVASQEKYISPDEKALILNWNKDPHHWQHAATH